MSAIDPVSGCSSNQAQMAAPARGSTAPDSASGQPLWTAAHWVVSNSS